MTTNQVVATSLIALMLLGVAVWRWQKRAAILRTAELLHQQNLERQQFLIARNESIRALLENPDLPLAELKARTDTLVAEMQSQNVGGDLDPLLLDTTEYLAEELAKRGYQK